ncbi:hypothetical protein NDU88_001677 [Pleurodeles waltl]|uniref:Uncharacterized protein n=1 Tax=Pleurodeles waltl TaxID=8319 RepID=A0AAV7KQW9_PLEWA|nr:hypothetical protein NDU88_001677 [Pleurodeles waltl]
MRLVSAMLVAGSWGGGASGGQARATEEREEAVAGPGPPRWKGRAGAWALSRGIETTVACLTARQVLLGDRVRGQWMEDPARKETGLAVAPVDGEPEHWDCKQESHERTAVAGRTRLPGAPLRVECKACEDRQGVPEAKETSSPLFFPGSVAFVILGGSG